MAERDPPTEQWREMRTVSALDEVAPPRSELASVGGGVDRPAEERSEWGPLLKERGSRRDYGLSPYSGFLVYKFDEQVTIHKGIFQAIGQRLLGRFPLVAIDGTEIHVSFALLDDSPNSCDEVNLVARALTEMLPECRLAQVAMADDSDFESVPSPRPVLTVAPLSAGQD